MPINHLQAGEHTSCPYYRYMNTKYDFIIFRHKCSVSDFPKNHKKCQMSSNKYRKSVRPTAGLSGENLLPNQIYLYQTSNYCGTMYKALIQQTSLFTGLS